MHEKDKSMSDQERTEKKATWNIKANMLITALFGVLVSGIGFVNHLQTKAAHDDTMASVRELKIELSGHYVSKTDFSSAIASLAATDSKLWEKEASVNEQLNKVSSEINLKLQHIEDSLPNKK